jgi:hypothetical protein
MKSTALLVYGTDRRVLAPEWKLDLMQFGSNVRSSYVLGSLKIAHAPAICPRLVRASMNTFSCVTSLSPIRSSSVKGSRFNYALGTGGSAFEMVIGRVWFFILPLSSVNGSRFGRGMVSDCLS